MSQTVLGFIGPKGGVGKSSCARAAAVEAARAGLSVKIADLDVKQGTSLGWWKRRMENGVTPDLDVALHNTVAEAMNGAREFDMLIMDAPGRSTVTTLDIARQADLVIQPVSASLDDLEPGVLLFHELAAKGIPASKLVFLINHISTLAELQRCQDYLAQTDYEALAGFLPERPAYRHAFNEGKAMTETPFLSLNKKARAVFTSLANRLS